jgi:hypothetical protein
MKENNFEDSSRHFHLQPYKGSDSSGIKGFEAGKTFIIIEFKDGRIYLYNHQKPGKENVEKMKTAALKGKELSTYINKYIRDKYAGRWHEELKRFIQNKN